MADDTSSVGGTGEVSTLRATSGTVSGLQDVNTVRMDSRRAGRRPGFGAVLVVTLLAAVLVTLPGQSPASAASLPAGFTSTPVFTGLTMPTSVAFAPDGRVFVAEKRGVVKVFPSVGSDEGRVFKNLSTKVYDYADRGLLGLTVDPRLGDGSGHDYVYVLYAKDAPPGQNAPVWNDDCPNPPGADTDGCVVAGTLSRISVQADGTGGAEEILIDDEWCQQFSSHSVGDLAFGPDGYLYVSGGEGASWKNADYGQFGGSLPNTPTKVNPCNDPPGRVGQANTSPSGRGGAMRSQSPRRPASEPRTLSGSVLRLDPDTGAGVPGNPDYSASAPSSNASRILAYGMRNPFRFTPRPETNEIWVGDVGWGTYEEINRITTTTPDQPVNFGWPCLEEQMTLSVYRDLTMCKDLYRDDADPPTDPFFAWDHDLTLGANDTCGLDEGSSVAGLAFYTGDRYPASYDDSLFVADSTRNCIWVMQKGAGGLPNPATARTFIDDADNPYPVNLKTDPVSGDIFYINIAFGTVNRISYATSNRAPVAVATASPTSGPAPLQVRLNGSGSSDPDGDALTYSWDVDGNGVFGDATGVTPTVSYPNGGTYHVRLRVTDTGGLTSTSSSMVITVGTAGGPVLNTPPTVSGSPVVAGTVTATNGTWTGSGISYSRQWQRCVTGAGLAATHDHGAHDHTADDPAAHDDAAHDPAAEPHDYGIAAAAATTCTDISGATGTSYKPQLSDLGATLRVRVTATNNGGSTNASSSEIGPVTAGAGNTAPVAQILTPASSTKWKAGDTLSYSGRATDAEDGNVPSAKLSWEIIIGHCPSVGCHQHPLMNRDGVASGTVAAPDHEAPSYLELTLTATDAAGAISTDVLRIDPLTVDLTFRTNPAGLSLAVGAEQAGPGPITQTWVVNSQVQLDAPQKQALGSTDHTFAGWSDGGAATHVINAPATNTTYTALYTAGVHPFGRFDSASSTALGQVDVSGWSVDPSAPTSPTAVHVYIGGPAGTPGAEARAITADRSRPDIGAAHPAYGARHGFRSTLTTGKVGRQQVCAYAINIGPGSNTSLGCRTVVIPGPTPTGGFDSASSPRTRQLRVRGWAADWNAPTSPVTIQVVIGGRRGQPGTETHALVANRRRDDLGRLYPALGPNHGFDTTIVTSKTGRQTVCIYAKNIGAGTDAQLGCRSVDIVK